MSGKWGKECKRNKHKREELVVKKETSVEIEVE